MTMTTLTLAEYADGRNNVVLFGVPFGKTLIGHHDFDFADRRGLLNLEGTLDDGYWRWNQQGAPTDDRGNRITWMHATPHPQAWTVLVNQFE